MATFYYRTKKSLEPRPGTNYATTYIKQDPHEHQRLLTWLVELAETILNIASVDPDLAAWFVRPMPDFRKSNRREYYSPQDIITDMIDQLAHGRDLPEAMLGRWNRMCADTPWQIDFVAKSQAKPQRPNSLFVF